MKKITAIILSLIMAIFSSYSVAANAWETWYVGARSGLNCRTAPATDAEILTTYPYGTELQIIGADGAWWESWDGDVQGWVHSDYLTDKPDGAHESDNLVYIGTFTITHFCPCYICNGSWGNHTAWADEIIPGQTIGVDPDMIGKLQWVYIDGYGWRRAEDCGGGVGGNHIDVAVATHEEALERGVVYRDVYVSR